MFVQINRFSWIKRYKKAIMIRSKLRNKFLRNRNESNKKAYSKQRNTCVNILFKTKKQCYPKFEVSKVVDNKKFWKTVKNFFPTCSKSTTKTSAEQCVKSVQS